MLWRTLSCVILAFIYLYSIYVYSTGTFISVVEMNLKEERKIRSTVLDQEESSKF